MPKQQRGFGPGFSEAYKDAAHTAMVLTLQELSRQPERDSEIASRTEAVEASKQKRGQEALAAPLERDKLKQETDTLKARAERLRREQKDLLNALGTGDRKTLQTIRGQKESRLKSLRLMGQDMGDPVEIEELQNGISAIDARLGVPAPEKKEEAPPAAAGSALAGATKRADGKVAVIRNGQAGWTSAPLPTDKPWDGKTK